MSDYLAKSYDAALRENATLKARLAGEQRYRAEAVDAATSFKARLAEAERLLAKIHDAPLPHAIRYDIVCFLERAADSASLTQENER